MTWNPQNAERNKRKFSLNHTYRSFFISFFRSFLSMMKPCPAEQIICSLHRTWYPWGRVSLFEPTSYSSKSERIWVRDAITPNTSHGVLGSGRDPGVCRAQASYPAGSRWELNWLGGGRAVLRTLSLSDTSYSFQVSQPSSFTYPCNK